MTRTTRTFRIPVQTPPPADWIPAQGIIKTVGLNTLDSQAPVLGGSQTSPGGVMDAWCGMTYAATFGQNGSLILHGGGHADYLYNEVYRYDVASRQWSRAVEPSYPIYLGPDNYYVDATYAEYYASAGGGSVRTGQASADHTYGHTLWLPQGSLGNDPAGYYYSTSTSSSVPGGQRGSFWPHYVPLSNPVWTRGGAAITVNQGFAPALYDSTRNLVVQLPGDTFSTSFCTINCGTQAVSTVTLSSYQNNGFWCWYGTGGFLKGASASEDLYMSANVGDVSYGGGGATLQLVNPTTRAHKYATISGVSTSGQDTGGWDWVQSWGAWVFYPGSGQVVFKLKKPADPWNQAWTMTSQTLSYAPGSTAQTTTGNPHYSRFRYVPSLDVFLWASRTSNNVQAFRVTAP